MAISETHVAEQVPAVTGAPLTSADVARLRLDFPALHQTVHNLQIGRAHV